MRLDLFDPVEERERLSIEAAVADVALHDPGFQRWWDLYRNRHHRSWVAILSYYSSGEGTYYWHFHLDRDLTVKEQEQLLAAMSSALHTALDTLGMIEGDALYSAQAYPLATVSFSVPVAPEEVQRRRETRRQRNAAYWQYDHTMTQVLKGIKDALAAKKPLPACPFCDTAISAEVKVLPLEIGATYCRAVLTCGTPDCFSAALPHPEQTA